MTNHKKLSVILLLLFVCLAWIPITVSGQTVPGWDIGPGWSFPDSYIVATSDSYSTITPNGTVAVAYGGYVVFDYAAFDGYAINLVLVDGVSKPVSSPTGSYAFYSVNANHTIAIFTVPVPTVTPTVPTPTPSPSPIGPTPTPVPNIHNHPTTTLNLYFRSDTYNYSGLTGYGLDTDYTNSYVSIPINSSAVGAVVTYGFRVYLAASDSNFLELTNGVPEAPITISGNQSAGTRSSSWNCPYATVVLGAQVLRVDVYAKVNSGDWTVQASYVSDVLMTKELMPVSWSFSLNLEAASTGSGTVVTYRFGDSTYRSGVSGVVFVDPNYTDIQTWQWMQGDIIGLILGSYLHVMGPIFYVLIYVMIFGGLYFRHRSISPVAFLVVFLGGAGGLSVWVLMPPLYAAIFSVFIIIAIAAIVFKVIR